MMILRTLRLQPMHGWGVAQRLQLLSRDVFQVNQGSLYPALHRLERKGFIDSEWAPSENNRRARYYRITVKGQRALESERESWERFAGAVARVLRTT